MATDEEILDRLIDVLVAALGVDEEDVTPAATLQGDLGAESIDLLDIIFHLEREFRVEVPRGELFPDPPCDGRADRDGGAMAAGDRSLAAAAEFLTVGQIARYVAWKLARAGGARPAPAAPTVGMK
jgi:acyl carrier protein